MGEIGIDRKEYLYDLTYSDLLLIERGYDRRCRQMWSAARWSTFYIMSSFAGSDNMKQNGITAPTDLLKFPWDKERVIITENEQNQLMKEIEAFNRMKGKPQH